MRNGGGAMRVGRGSGSRRTGIGGHGGGVCGAGVAIVDEAAVGRAATMTTTILDAMESPELFGPFFSHPDWRAWKAFLGALYGLPLGASLRPIAARHTAREAALDAPVREAWMCVGRRGGKSRIAALLATYTACFHDYRPHMAPGELARIPVIAADMDQAGAIFGYVRGFLDAVPALRAMVKGRITGHRVELGTGVEIIVRAATFRGLRSRPTPLILCDEIAFWRNEESSNPDHEILRALRPGMLTIPGSMLIGLSSPYARKGVLWEAYRKYYGQPDPRVLVWQASTTDMHPSADAEGEITRAYEDDPIAAAAEYGGEFRRDLEAYLSLEVLDAITVRDRKEVPPIWGQDYAAFVDPSGGSQDSMTLAIAHPEGDGLVLDYVAEKSPPFSPDGVCAEFAAILKRYKILSVRGDRYAGEWPRERFTVHGIGYDPCDVPKSDLYLQCLPFLTGGRVQLLDQPRLLSQLAGLDRRTARGGRDSIDHPPGGHDDVANAAVGALLDATRIGTAPQATNLAKEPIARVDWSQAP